MKVALQDFFRLNRLVVVQLSIGDNELLGISAYTLLHKGDTMQVENRQDGLKSVLHFAKNFKSGAVLLCLTGKGILQKHIPGSRMEDVEALTRVIPNAKPEDFYIQNVWAGEQNTLTLIRRAVADNLIAEFIEKGYTVIGLCLGEEGAVQENAVRLMLGLEAVKTTNGTLQKHLEQLLAKLRLQGILILGSILVLFLLLCNFFIFSHYASRVQELQRAQQLSGEQIKKYHGMEAQLAQETAFIQSAGWLGGYSYSWVTEQLMVSKPLQVKISTYSINPLKGMQVAEESRVYEHAVLRLKGTTTAVGVLNNWLNQLRTMNWVKACDLLDYALNLDTGDSEFDLEIVLNNYERRVE